MVMLGCVDGKVGDADTTHNTTLARLTLCGKLDGPWHGRETRYALDTSASSGMPAAKEGGCFC